MRRIGLISDTHGFLDPRVLELFADVDEVWHAGDIGSVAVLEQLRAFRPLRAVWGNADGRDVRLLLDSSPRVIYDEDAPDADPMPDTMARDGIVRFTVEGVDVVMTHIGGYPGRYAKAIGQIMKSNPPSLFVAGHSHILKVMYDDKHDCLHLNPGACGRYGIHAVRTCLTFTLCDGNIADMQVIELSQP